MDIGRIIMDLVDKKKSGGATSSTAGIEPTGAPSGGSPPPEGVPTAMPAPIAAAYKSPPDLIAMYSKMIEKSQKQERIDQGLTLIAAGFAQPQNRPALLAMAGQAGSGGAGAPSLAQLLDLKKYQDEQEATSARRAALPDIMDEYGLSAATVEYLDRTGQLDETLSALANPETTVFQSHDGSQRLINSDTGETIKDLSGAKPRATEYVEKGDKTKVLVYSDTKEPVKGGPAVTEIAAPPRDIIQIDDPSGSGGKISVYKDTMEPIAGGPPVATSARPVGNITIETLANGQKQPFQDGKPIAPPVGPETNLTPDSVRTWQAAQADNVANGQPVEGLDEFMVRMKHAETEAGTTADLNKSRYGNAPPGKFWIFNADGSVRIDPETGEPQTGWIKDSKEYADFLKADTEAKSKAAEASAAEATSAEAEASEGVKQTIQLQNIDNALTMINNNKDSFIGVGGFGGLLGWIPTSEQGTFNNIIYGMKDVISLDQLKSMRAASTSGASGLGQVTEKEHAMLANVWGNTQPTDDPAVIEYNLRRVRAGMILIADGVDDPDSPGRMPTEAEIAAAMAAIPVPPQFRDKSAPAIDRGSIKVRPKVIEDPNADIPTGD